MLDVNLVSPVQSQMLQHHLLSTPNSELDSLDAHTSTSLLPPQLAKIGSLMVNFVKMVALMPLTSMPIHSVGMLPQIFQMVK
jgi:hypothetical protein